LVVQGGFCLGISDKCILCFNQINLPYQFLLVYCPAPLLFNNLQLIVL
jgi:hypothetical protein